MTKLLDPDTFRRDAGPIVPGTRRHLHDTLVFGALIVVSLGLLTLSKLDQPVIGVVRMAIETDMRHNPLLEEINDRRLPSTR